jgi:hypothetical protein
MKLATTLILAGPVPQLCDVDGGPPRFIAVQRLGD